MNEGIVKTVRRGFINRFNPEEFYDEVLYLIPKGAELFDSDAVPYYIDNGDGTPLRAFYGHYAPYDKDCYQTEEPYEETLKYINEQALIMKKQFLEAREEEKKNDKKAALRMKIQESMYKKHKR